MKPGQENMSVSHFHPDVQAHLAGVRDALWEPSGSKLSLFVGAGFSANAVAIDPGHARLPDWKALAILLCKQLVAEPLEQVQVIRDMGGTSEGYMRLAQYFEAKFGRAALDRFIVQSISDALFQPGPAHRQLLSLPWREVFTTNWDTLLERAANEISDPLYFPVVDERQLMTAGHPRIVKLHGCVERNRRFVFSEEDYRTYPSEHAPYVTVVRNALLEGPVCLIGFSGEDPNFRQWVGWVRDTLPSRHPLFLMHVVEEAMPDFQVARLRDQGVTVLRLGVPGASASVALNRLLEFLKAGALRRWPAVLQHLSPGGGGDESFVNAASNVCAEYPGWLLCPMRYRAQIFHRIRNLDDLVFSATWPLERSLRYMASVAQLRDWSGTGLFSSDLNAVDACLAAALASRPSLSQAMLQDTISLALSRAQQARHDLQFGAYAKTVQLLEDLTSVAPHLRQHLQLESAMYALACLDIAKAKARIAEFSSPDPFLQLRAMSLRVELQSDHHIEHAMDALERQVTQLVREHPYSERYASLEDVFRRLQDNVRAAMAWDRLEVLPSVDQPDRRSERRRGLECEVASELRLLDAVLEHPPSVEKSGRVRRAGFSVGTLNTSYRFNNDLPKGLLPAYLMARCPDAIGLLVRTSRANFLISALADSARWLLDSDLNAGLAVTLRLLTCGHTKVLREEISRARVATIDSATIEAIWPHLMRALQQGMQGRFYVRSHASCDFFAGCLHLAAKLVIRLSEPQGRELIEFIFSWGIGVDISEELQSDRRRALEEASHVVSASVLSETINTRALEALNSGGGALELAELLVAWSDRFPDGLALDRSALVAKALLRLCEIDQRTRKVGMLVVHAVDQLDPLDRAEREAVADALWGSNVWPDLGGSINRGYLVQWAGRYTPDVQALVVQELLSATSPEEIVILAHMLLSVGSNGDHTPLVPSTLKKNVLEHVAAALESFASARTGTHELMGGDNTPRKWGLVLAGIVAASGIRNQAQINKLVVTAMRSDLWSPGAAVWLLGATSWDRDLLLASIARESSQPDADDDPVIRAIAQLFRDSDARLAFGDVEVLLDEISWRLRQSSEGQAESALAVAASVVAEHPEVLNARIAANWLLSAIRYANAKYDSDRPELREYTPGLRRAAAHLLASLLRRDSSLKTNDAVAKALQSFGSDQLPEVRRAIADL